MIVHDERLAEMGALLDCPGHIVKDHLDGTYLVNLKIGGHPGGVPINTSRKYLRLQAGVLCFAFMLVLFMVSGV